MLEVFFGTDKVAVRDSVQAYVVSQGKEVIVSRLEASSYELGSLENSLGATSLFGEVLLCVIDSPEERADFKAEVDRLLSELSESLTQYVVVTSGLLVADKKRLTTLGATLHEHTTPPKPREDTFALTEALARKDKKSLWLLYQEARRAGKSAEEIIGLLWWQLKALRLASVTSEASEAGMKAFPYQKAKQALRYFKSGELDVLSTTLLSVYHDGHAGTRDIDLALESWVLDL